MASSYLSYGNTLLNSQEVEFLIELEDMLGQPVPDISYHPMATFGYVHNNYSITDLRIFLTFFDDSQKINFLPDTISNLSNLQTLDISHNLVSELPASITKLQELENLYLDFNRFEDFPRQILQLFNLRKLNLSDNNIRHLPSDFSSLPYLESVMLSGNLLTEFPTEFSNNRYLKRLNLARNRISNIRSSDIEIYKNLYSLDIRDNEVQTNKVERLLGYLRLIGLHNRKFYLLGAINDIDNPFSLKNLKKKLKSDFRNEPKTEEWISSQAELILKLYNTRYD